MSKAEAEAELAGLKVNAESKSDETQPLPNTSHVARTFANSSYEELENLSLGLIGVLVCGTWAQQHRRFINTASVRSLPRMTPVRSHLPYKTQPP